MFAYFEVPSARILLQLVLGLVRRIVDSGEISAVFLFAAGKEENLISPYIIKLIKCKPQIELHVQKCPQDER